MSNKAIIYPAEELNSVQKAYNERRLETERILKKYRLQDEKERNERHLEFDRAYNERRLKADLEWERISAECKAHFAAPAVVIVPIIPISSSADIVAATEEEFEDLDSSAGVKDIAAPICEATETSNSPINLPSSNIVKATAAPHIVLLPEDAEGSGEVICGDQCEVFDPGGSRAPVGNRKTMVLRSDTRTLASQSAKHGK